MHVMTAVLWAGIISGGIVVFLYLLYMLVIWLFFGRNN